MNHLSRVIRIWSLSLLICAALGTLSFARVDVPVARYCWRADHFLNPLGDAFGSALILAAQSIVVLTMVVVRLVRGRLSPFGETLAIACLTSICAYSVNDHLLKVFFGVPNPQAVVRGARHGFNLWMGSVGSGFPSGHMVLAAAFAGVFMRYYKASIWPLSALLLLAAGLLIVGDWHFVSDVIAGAFVGLTAGFLAGEARAARSIPSTVA